MKERVYDTSIKIQEFILLLMIVLECNTVYHSMYIGISTTMLYLFGANIVAYILIFLWVKRDRTNIEYIKEKKYLLLVLFVVVLLFYAINVVKTDSVGYLGDFLFFMDAMIILYSIYRRNGKIFELIFKLEQIIVFMCIVSVILWVGSVLFGMWGYSEDIQIRWIGGSYYSNYLNLFVRRAVGEDITKNIGIFVEPPMFGLMISFCLYTEFFLKKKMNPLIVIILLVTLASSRAILGIMVSLLACFIKFLEMIRGKKYAKPITIVSIMCTIAGLILLVMYKKKVGWGSFAVHLDDFAATFKCWKDNILFGCGYEVKEPIVAYMSEFRITNTGLSNSFGMVLAQGGLYLFMIYLIPFALLMSRFFKGNRRLAYWGGGTFALWVVVVFPDRLFSFFIIALGYSFIEIKVVNSEKKKKISLGYADICDNMSNENDKAFWDSDILGLSNGVTVVSMILILIFSVWGITGASTNGAVSIIAAGLCILTEISVAVMWIKKKTNPANKLQMGLQAVLWIIMIAAGSLYKVADSLYRAIGMRIQDNWWMSIVAIIVLYTIGTVVDQQQKWRK